MKQSRCYPNHCYPYQNNNFSSQNYLNNQINNNNQQRNNNVNIPPVMQTQNQQYQNGSFYQQLNQPHFQNQQQYQNQQQLLNQNSVNQPQIINPQNQLHFINQQQYQTQQNQQFQNVPNNQLPVILPQVPDIRNNQQNLDALCESLMNPDEAKEASKLKVRGNRNIGKHGLRYAVYNEDHEVMIQLRAKNLPDLLMNAPSSSHKVKDPKLTRFPKNAKLFNVLINELAGEDKAFYAEDFKIVYCWKKSKQGIFSNASEYLGRTVKEIKTLQNKASIFLLISVSGIIRDREQAKKLYQIDVPQYFIDKQLALKKQNNQIGFQSMIKKSKQSGFTSQQNLQIELPPQIGYQSMGKQQKFQNQQPFFQNQHQQQQQENLLPNNYYNQQQQQQNLLLNNNYNQQLQHNYLQTPLSSQSTTSILSELQSSKKNSLNTTRSSTLSQSLINPDNLLLYIINQKKTPIYPFTANFKEINEMVNMFGDLQKIKNLQNEYDVRFEFLQLMTSEINNLPNNVLRKLFRIYRAPGGFNDFIKKINFNGLSRKSRKIMKKKNINLAKKCTKCGIFIVDNKCVFCEHDVDDSDDDYLNDDNEDDIDIDLHKNKNIKIENNFVDGNFADGNFADGNFADGNFDDNNSDESDSDVDFLSNRSRKKKLKDFNNKSNSQNENVNTNNSNNEISIISNNDSKRSTSTAKMSINNNNSSSTSSLQATILMNQKKRELSSSISATTTTSPLKKRRRKLKTKRSVDYTLNIAFDQMTLFDLMEKYKYYTPKTEDVCYCIQLKSQKDADNILKSSEKKISDTHIIWPAKINGDVVTLLSAKQKTLSTGTKKNFDLNIKQRDLILIPCNFADDPELKMKNVYDEFFNFYIKAKNIKFEAIPDEIIKGWEKGEKKLQKAVEDLQNKENNRNYRKAIKQNLIEHLQKKEKFEQKCKYYQERLGVNAAYDGREDAKDGKGLILRKGSKIKIIDRRVTTHHSLTQLVPAEITHIPKWWEFEVKPGLSITTTPSWTNDHISLETDVCLASDESNWHPLEHCKLIPTLDDYN